MCAKRLLVLLLALLAAVCLIRGDAFGQAATTRQRPVLVYWTADWCSYCRQFEADMGADPAFRAAILSRYRIVRRDFDRERAAAYLSGVFHIPAFIGQDGRRAVGYTTANDLLWRLKLPHGQTRPRPPAAITTAPEQTGPPAGSTGPRSPASAGQAELAELQEQLAAQAEQLKQWQAGLEQKLDQRDQQAAEQARRAAEQLQADLNATRAALAEQQAAGGHVVDLTGGTDLEQAGGNSSRSAAASGTDNQPGRQPEPAGPWNWILPIAAAVLERKGLAAGLSIGGPIGVAAVAGGWLLRRWWRGRSTAGETTGPAGPAEQPAPAEPITPAASGNSPATPGRCAVCDQLRQTLEQQSTAASAEQARLRAELDRTAGQLEQATAEGVKTETRYVRVPVPDPEGECFREALRRVAERQPSAIGILNQVESAAAQLLHGHRVKTQAGAAPDAKPGIWSDTPERVG